ncbi:MAG: hypothetical protein ACRDJH_12875 [Thermomicrobiales bacterium]
MLTQAQVIEELERRGYEMTPRRLVDWRQKGLLPPLAKHGRGQGRGWIYGWDDPLVIEQAIAVEELLALRSRTDWLYLPLWCLGFNIPVSQIRPQLLAIVGANLEHVVGDEMTPGGVADRISKLAVTQAQSYQPERSRHPELSAEAVEYWLNLLAGSTDYSPNQTALIGIAESLWHSVNGGRPQTGRDNLWRAEPRDLRRLRRWFSQHASLPLARDAAVKVSDDGLQSVQDDWRSIARLVRAFGQADHHDAWWEFHRFWIRLVSVFGPELTLLDLSLRRHGRSPLLESLREQVDNMAVRVESDPDIRSKLRDS